ncbi:hypothetical protein CLCHR_39100 [Clostridium chromiireducens]|uniref:Uncharacterized protein n=1 Tax=Clostridium chromiireducens TaxID=225345 RepID=A0A1V4IEP2_9CLOT|nr:hypothetical protein CLCHR_39100 [Clostridium chromiireducens]
MIYRITRVILTLVIFYGLIKDVRSFVILIGDINIFKVFKVVSVNWIFKKILRNNKEVFS